MWQPSLLSYREIPAIDGGFLSLERVHLDADSWVDHAPAWLSGSDTVFEQVLASRDWQQRSRRMYDRRVQEPRLTSPWTLQSGIALEPPVLEEIRLALRERYEHGFDSVGFNLYRDGNDNVAWHADRIPPEIEGPVVALVSLGEPRPFRLRPKERGAAPVRTFFLGRGDLLVTGGNAQRTWEHSVPKVAATGPRISLAYRHGRDPKANAHKRSEPHDPGRDR